MPSKSPAQHRLMEAAAHTPGGYGGVPEKVGKEFVAKDDSVHKYLDAVTRGDAQGMQAFCNSCVKDRMK